jgi:hypothetical protein
MSSIPSLNFTPLASGRDVQAMATCLGSLCEFEDHGESGLARKILDWTVRWNILSVKPASSFWPSGVAPNDTQLIVINLAR